MKTWLKVLLIALPLAVVAFMTGSNTPLGANIWPPAADVPEPTSAQIPLLMLLGAISSIAFGLGIAFLVLGWPLTQRITDHKGLGIATHLSITWFLINWYPHENLHIANGLALGGLIMIEYLFHVTMIIAGLTIAYAWVGMLSKGGPRVADAAA